MRIFLVAILFLVALSSAVHAVEEEPESGLRASGAVSGVYRLRVDDAKIWFFSCVCGPIR